MKIGLKCFDTVVAFLYTWNVSSDDVNLCSPILIVTVSVGSSWLPGMLVAGADDGLRLMSSLSSGLSNG